MYEYMTFWLAKFVTEFLLGISIVLGGILLLFIWFIVYAYIIGPIKEHKEFKYWKSQTPQWRRNKINSMHDSFRMEDWPKKWQRDMVEDDNREYR